MHVPARFRRPVGLPLLAALFAAAAAWWIVRGVSRPARARLADGRLRFALCQYDSRPDAFDWNLRHALSYAQEAADHGAGFIVLPEYSFCTADDALTGGAFPYFRRNAKRIEAVLGDFCRKNRCYLLVNIPYEKTSRAKVGGIPARKNRSMLIGPSGRRLATYDKRNSAILDTIAGTKAGETESLVELPFGRIGLMICRDSSYPQLFPSYREADAIVVQFAHITDWTEENRDDPIWLTNDMGTSQTDFPRIGKHLVRAFGRPFALFANKTGFEPNGGFIGSSCALSKDGIILAKAGFGSDILYIDSALDESGRLSGDPPVPFRPNR